MAGTVKAKKQKASKTGIKIWEFIYKKNSVSDEHLDRIAVIDNDRSYTYRQFFRHWEQYAEVFTGLGITGENHSRIGIIMAPGIHCLSAVYGANMAGVSVSAINETEAFNIERFTEMIRKEEITDLIVDNTFMTPGALKEIMKRREECGLRNVILAHKKYNVTKFCQPVISQATELNYRQLKMIPGVLHMNELRIRYEATPVNKSRTPDDAAYIVHTSGTTKGIHKPIPLSDKAVNESAARILDDPAFETLKGGTVLTSGFISGAFYFLDQMNLAHAAGCTAVYLPLGYMNPNHHKAIKEYGITVVVTAPMLFDNYLFKRRNDKDIDFSTVEYIVLGGAFVSGQKRKEINEFIAEKGGRVKAAVGYGLSEVGSAAILAAPGCEDDSIGYPMRGVKVRILDEADNQFHDITEGQRTGGLYLYSTSISSGKIGDTQFFETEKIDGDEYICTYDRVSVNEDGSLTCHGRMNRYFINNEGIKFDAGLVEVSMEKEADIEECAIVPSFDKDLHDTVPVLYIKTKETGEAARQVLKKALYNVFVNDNTAEKTNLPNKCVITKELPHNQAGKVDIYQIINDGVSGDTYAIVAVRQEGVLKDVRVMPVLAAAMNPGTMPQEMEEEYKKSTIPMVKMMDILSGNRSDEKPKMPDFKTLLSMIGCNPKQSEAEEDTQNPYDAFRTNVRKPEMGCNPAEDDEEYEAPQKPYDGFRKPFMGCNPWNAGSYDDEDDEDDAPSPRYNPAVRSFLRPLMGCNPFFNDDDEEDD